MLNLNDVPSRPLVAPSILAADFGAMAAEAGDVLDKGADLLHLDVMDGHFVANLTMGRDMIRGLRQHLPDAFLDVHLMVERPDEYLDDFADAGANCFSFHLEVCRDGEGRRAEGRGPRGRIARVDAHDLIDRIHARGMCAGMVINPATPAQPLEPLLDRLDLVLVMSVHPGQGGQAFIPAVLDKTRWLKERLKPETRLEMDGGLNVQTSRQAVAAGIDILVAGSAIFRAPDRTAVIRQLHTAPA